MTLKCNESESDCSVACWNDAAAAASYIMIHVYVCVHKYLNLQFKAHVAVQVHRLWVTEWRKWGLAAWHGNKIVNQLFRRHSGDSHRNRRFINIGTQKERSNATSFVVAFYSIHTEVCTSISTVPVETISELAERSVEQKSHWEGIYGRRRLWGRKCATSTLSAKKNS